MDIEPSAQIILSNLTRGSQEEGVSMGQIRMWLVPQKAEHEHDYNINKGYFEMLMHNALKDLLSKGYVRTKLPDGAEDGDTRVFYLTESGAKHLEELAKLQAEQAAFDY
jgi:hypothetical protein